MQITDGQYAAYAKIINNFSANANKEIVRWGKREWMEDEFGENNANPLVYTDLEALIQFNTFRTWPMTKHTVAGELDEQNLLLYLNREYLSENGWLTPEGYFHFDPAKDEFIHRGLRYKAEGDTLASQAQDNPLFVLIVLARQETKTGTDRDAQS